MSWKCLWDPRFRNKILMKDSYRDAYGTAIIYAHARELANGTITVEQLMNDSSPEMIAIAEEYLNKMKDMQNVLLQLIESDISFDMKKQDIISLIDNHKIREKKK